MNVQVKKDDKIKILRFSQQRFFSDGFHKTSIDEIAKDLRMSRNTIYKYFPTKESLVIESIDEVIQTARKHIASIIESNENAVFKFVRLLNFLSGTIMRFKEKWFRDLQLHSPHIWKRVDEMRRKLMYENLSKLIEQGKKERNFEDYPSEIILTVFINSLRSVVNPEFLLNTRLSNQEAVGFTFKILLKGILTKKGKEKFQKIKLF